MPDDFDDRIAASIDVAGLTATADRLDDLAEMAELMGDDRQAIALRERSQVARLRAMHVLDGWAPPGERPEAWRGRSRDDLR